jgi:hypothetical protein
VRLLLLLARITEVPCTFSKTRKCNKAEQLFRETAGGRREKSTKSLKKPNEELRKPNKPDPWPEIFWTKMGKLS